jgi:hypothetical protein
MESRWYRLLFVGWYYLGVGVVLNLCVAFVLETFATEWRHTIRTRKQEKQANLDRFHRKLDALRYDARE